MQAHDGTLRIAAPAWPSLLGLQLVLAALLVGAWWHADEAAGLVQTPVEAQVLDLDASATAPSVDAALSRARRSARALTEADQSGASSFLALTASAADLQVVGLQIHAASPAQAAVPGTATPVDVELRLRGDAFDLPVFLDGLHLQAPTVRVRALAAAVAPGGATEARISLQAWRPVLPAADELLARVQRTVPAAGPETRTVLARAGQLRAWRAFAAGTPARAVAAEQVRARLLRELPAGLVAARASGGRVSWSPATGLEVRRLVGR